MPVRVQVAGFLGRSSVNGPGTRAVVWVQGCPLRCPGCFNRSMWPFHRGTAVPVDALAERILTVPGIRGITFSGGEPFAQAGPLAVLAGILRGGGLDVLTYSGYPYETLCRGDRPARQALLAATDILVDGPFVRALACPGPLRGSANQRILRLENGRPAGPAGVADDGGTVEFRIGPGGDVTTTGIPARTPAAGRGWTCPISP